MSIKNFGEPRQVLGMQFIWGDVKVATLRKLNLIDKLLDKTPMKTANPIKSHMSPGVDLTIKTYNLNDVGSTTYRSILGSMLYHILKICPDICATECAFGSHAADPMKNQWLSMKRVLRF